MYEKLKEEREKQGYTIQDMARVIDKSVPNYSMLKNKQEQLLNERKW